MLLSTAPVRSSNPGRQAAAIAAPALRFRKFLRFSPSSVGLTIAVLLWFGSQPVKMILRVGAATECRPYRSTRLSKPLRCRHSRHLCSTLESSTHGRLVGASQAQRYNESSFLLGGGLGHLGSDPSAALFVGKLPFNLSLVGSDRLRRSHHHR